VEHPVVRERHAVCGDVCNPGDAALQRAAQMVGRARRGVEVGKPQDDERRGTERRQDVAARPARHAHGEQRERDADDDSAATVGAEPVLRDHGERQSADGEECGPTPPFHQQLRADQRGREQQRLEDVRDPEEAARQLRADRRERERPRLHDHHHPVRDERSDHQQRER
jgi:hypothetical protein